MRSNVLAVADETVRNCRQHGYASPIGSLDRLGLQRLCGAADDDFDGGGPPDPQATERFCTAPNCLRQPPGGCSGKPEYRAACQDALNFLFGRNYYCRSFVTGVGFNPPEHPHDRRSAADHIVEPWPGYLVGGPNPKATDWKDIQDDARLNEIAINWNSALIYALAAFLPNGTDTTGM